MARYLAKLGAPAVGWIKLRAIEYVEELAPELEGKAFTRPKLSVLKGREVEVLLPIATYIRLGTRIRAIAIVVRGAGREYGSVVPLIELLLFGTGSQVRRSASRRRMAA